MSGTTSALIQTAATAAAAFAGLFNGTGALILGDMTLVGFELPEKVSYGGTQSLVDHQFPGGNRVRDAMGAFDSDISWSGIFMDAFAAIRAQQIDAMRISGQVVPLAWGMFSFAVLVKETSFDSFARRNEYRVTVTVLPDPQPDDDPLGDDGSTGPGDAPSTSAGASEMGNGGLTRATSATQPDTAIAPNGVVGPLVTGPAGLVGQV